MIVEYKGLYQDYKTGSGADRVEWNMTLHGPMAGLAIDFQEHMRISSVPGLIAPTATSRDAQLRNRCVTRTGTTLRL